MTIGELFWIIKGDFLLININQLVKNLFSKGF